jgi:rhodanese-related sulfurtransferase
MTNRLPATDLVSAAELQQLMATHPHIRLLDVRTGGEFETSHIPGSFNVPLDTLSEYACDLADVKHPVVLVCQSGGRATEAHHALIDEGKEALHILEGGINAWKEIDGDIVHGSRERWAMDRQVRLIAGSMALAGVLASVVISQAKWIAAGVGLGLVYSSISNSCVMAAMLSKLPYNKTDQCDVASVINEMNVHETSTAIDRERA